MKRYYLSLALFLFACCSVIAQPSVKNARKKSWQAFVYRIPADTAEKYVTKVIGSLAHYLSETPFMTLPLDSLKKDEWPIGNYLIISTDDNDLRADFFCRSNLQVLPLNNKRLVQLEIRDGEGRYIEDAGVWVNGKALKYDAAARTYLVKDKRPDEAVVKIAIPGDTLFMEFSAREEMRKGSWSQWWTRFSYTKFGHVVSWPVRSVKKLVTQPAYQWFAKKRKRYSDNGYMVFNKPKYQPRDSVRLKAYILSRKGKQYKKPLNLFLEYYDGENLSQKLTRLSPVTPGAFVYEFPLGDSLSSDRRYNIVFKNRKQKIILSRNFMLEDYVLDEVATYSLKPEKKTYFNKDTLVFSCLAKDANGLPLMDGRVKLYVLAGNIAKTYKDREFIPDTLWQEEKTLAIEGDTKFQVPATHFPAADLALNIKAEFRNSNNELQEKTDDVDFVYRKSLLQVKQEGGNIKAEYMDNGISASRRGWLKKSNQVKMIPVDFPYSVKIDPYSASYKFLIKNEPGNITDSAFFEPEQYYTLSFSRIQQKDTAGFYLYNPNEAPVHYAVFFGNKMIDQGSDSSTWISWKKELSVRRAFRVEWNYIWAGEEQHGSNTVAVLDKVLETNIAGASAIYPGQTDTITVTVKDYKGRPADKVNLTAVSYNSQFARDIHVSEPPYLKKYRNMRKIERDAYDLDDATFTSNFSLGENKGWIRKFGLDSMIYYKLLFPEKNSFAASTFISDFLPQLAIHVVKKGRPQEIYLLYLNLDLVYYNGVTDKSKYAFQVMPGYTKVGIRLLDKYITIDSIYMQPNYKQDISFDLDNLPANAVIKEMPKYYTFDERDLIERSVWQLQNDDKTNYGYVWQNNKLVHIGSGSPHLIGPFERRDSLQFFKPGGFDLRFPFESGYQYRLTPKMARLERMNIFRTTEKVKLPVVFNSTWTLGDTIIPAPVIAYTKPVVYPYLKSTVNAYSTTTGTERGKLEIELPADSSFQYAVLYKPGDTSVPLVKNYYLNHFYNLEPGLYDLVLITNHFRYLVFQGLDVQKNGTFFIKPVPLQYNTENNYIDKWVNDQWLDRSKITGEIISTVTRPVPPSPGFSVPEGTASISGMVIDKNGKKGIPYVYVNIKGTKTSVTTDINGLFSIKNIKEGNYVIVFSAVGYVIVEKRVTAAESPETMDIQMAMSQQALEDVIVVGYGISRKREMTGSISTVRGEELTSVLMGKLPGITIDGYRDSTIRIRGMASFNADNKPLYVINGVVMDELPEGFDMDKAKISILKDATATSIYGARAANGAIVITTPDFLPKELRDTFRDYAFWKPNLLTNKEGGTRFTVTYPDNITGWQTYVVGMDKKKRITKATTFVKSFKPLLAQLSAPQFLVAGDSASFIGKTINYTNDAISVSNTFMINGVKRTPVSKQLAANTSSIDELLVVAEAGDSLSAQFSATVTSGYGDGELRKIPVVRRGIEEARGSFWIFNQDSSVSFSPEDSSPIIIHAQNNTLDVLLDEIDHLKEYPYYCMEQTASKLLGYVMEKKIREALKERFMHGKELQQLLSKLQKAQSFEGGWSWWEGGEPNLAITNYVTQSLLALRDNPLVETNIRNALLYLQNRLSRLRRDELLSALFTMSEADHLLNYKDYLNHLPFDSLTLHQQWQVVKIKQRQKLDYQQELNKVMSKQIGTMLGGLHWGEESYYWDRNEMATTVLAFRTLENEKKYTNELQAIIQFFLEHRKNGRWMNTVESASIVSAILPSVLKNNTAFTEPTVLQIQADSSVTVKKFPFTATIPSQGKPVQVIKKGGGLVYCTAYQKVFNAEPLPVTGRFNINTWFERRDNIVPVLQAGEKVTLHVKLEAVSDAEYVQVEIPIPAGCTYGEKRQEGGNMHKEFLKDKAIFFIEKMPKGVYEYRVELEARYAGIYTINPAKAELMYFPVFFGRNQTKKIPVKK